MIWYLKWKILDLDFNKVLILTASWIWYEVGITEITYADFSLKADEEVNLYIYHHITENSESLFGFQNKTEKKVFEELLKISWVWWKVALQILSMWVARLSQAVRDEDKKTIEQIKGIWKKMAEKIVLELKDKDFIELWISVSESKEKTKVSNLEKSISDNVKSTLVSMWYAPKDVDRVLSELPEWLDKLEDIIPFAIKNL